MRLGPRLSPCVWYLSALVHAVLAATVWRYRLFTGGLFGAALASALEKTGALSFHSELAWLEFGVWADRAGYVIVGLESAGLAAIGLWLRHRRRVAA
jgi:hypothetical protein